MYDMFEYSVIPLIPNFMEKNHTGFKKKTKRIISVNMLM